MTAVVIVIAIAVAVIANVFVTPMMIAEIWQIFKNFRVINLFKPCMQTFICSKSTIETLEKDLKSAQS